MSTPNSVLVVCVGNICRSPMAEYKLKSYDPSWKIESAGLAAVVGHGACDRAIEVASTQGLNLKPHVAQQLQAIHAMSFSIILAMESSHVDAIQSMCPPLRGRTFLYGNWDNIGSIADPYQKPIEHYQKAFDLIDRASYRWAEALGMQQIA